MRLAWIGPRSRRDYAPITFNSILRIDETLASCAAPASGWGCAASANVISMRSGERFDFRNPRATNFKIRDVAFGLSQIVRFTGQARGGYSVAQHSVLASYIVDAEFAYDTLMHDGHEVVMGDCSSPLKRMLPDYQRMEHEVCDAFRAYFGCSLRDLPAVKKADMVMLATEFRDVMTGIEASSDCAAYRPLAARIHVWPAWYARWRFLRRFKQLVGNRVTHEMACC